MKEEYIEYCRTHEVPIFMQPWWLDAVCCEGKEWRIILSKKNGEIVCALPYLYRKKWGIDIGMQLQFTQLINASFTDDFPSLIDNEKLAWFFQNISADDKNADIFKNESFVVKNRFTYRINDLKTTDIMDIYARFSQNKKRQIDKAENAEMRLDETLSTEELYQFHKATLKQRRAKIFYSKKLFCTMCNAAIDHEQGKILAARSKEGDLLAAVLLVLDKQFCYYLVPAFDKEKAKSGASAWLTFEAIKFAKNHSNIFDFEGSMIGAIAKNYKQFGSVMCTYYRIEKVYNPLLRKVLNLHKFLKHKF